MMALLEALFETEWGIIALGVVLVIAVIICYFQK